MPKGAGYSRLLPVIVILSITSSSRPANSKANNGRPVCKPSIEFWSTDEARCMPCTVCEPAFTISPCAVHRDATCGPFSALELNWSFFSTRKRLSSTAATPKVWPLRDTKEQKKDANSKDATDNKRELDDLEYSSSESENVLETKGKWSIDGSMPWDWQTGGLVLAVCACIVFFIVAGCSAIVYVRDWRKMKKNFERASLEEISTRLNLMVKAELAELTSGAPMNPGDPETRCQYLEKLLDRKRESPMVTVWPEVGSNLYIEEGETPPGKHTQIARIHRNIESILKNKPR